MKTTILRVKRSVVQGSILVVLLCMLFTMMSLTAFAADQRMQGARAVPLPFSGKTPSGNALLQWNPQTKMLTVTLHVSGLQPLSDHAAHIHAGPCSKEGNIMYPFKNVVADTVGNGTSITSIKNITSGIPASGWNVTVHSGPTAQASTLLCGDIVNPKGATAVSVLLSTIMP